MGAHSTYIPEGWRQACVGVPRAAQLPEGRPDRSIRSSPRFRCNRATTRVQGAGYTGITQQRKSCGVARLLGGKERPGHLGQWFGKVLYRRFMGEFPNLPSTVSELSTGLAARIATGTRVPTSYRRCPRLACARQQHPSFVSGCTDAAGAFELYLDRVWSSGETLRGDNMRRIDALLTLALSAALILALGGICATSEEDTSDTDDPSSDEAAPPSEAPG